MTSTDRPEVRHTWRTMREAVAIVGRRENLRRTIATAAVVGTVLFAINQLDVVLRGDATVRTWAKTAITYLVPFAVANVGVLIGTRRT